MHKYTASGALGSSWHPLVDEDGNRNCNSARTRRFWWPSALGGATSIFREVEFIGPLLPLSAGEGASSCLPRALRQAAQRLRGMLWKSARHPFRSRSRSSMRGLAQRRTSPRRLARMSLRLHTGRRQARYQTAAEEYLWSDADVTLRTHDPRATEGVLTRDIDDSFSAGPACLSLGWSRRPRAHAPDDERPGRPPPGEVRDRGRGALRERLVSPGEARTSRTFRVTPGSSARAGWPQYHIALANTLDGLHARSTGLHSTG